jgi:hypothetical protein
MLRRTLPVALTCLVILPAAVPAATRAPGARPTKVPRWDARGVGPLAWQGVACLDVNDEATRIALGTIAPAGDPNVLLLDGDGRLLRQQRAGQRWINQAALGPGGVLRAVCTMPAGRSAICPKSSASAPTTSPPKPSTGGGDSTPTATSPTATTPTTSPAC